MQDQDRLLAMSVLDERLKAELYLAQYQLNQGALREAYLLFGRAAQSGHPFCLNMLGRAYEQGWGTKRDVSLARSLFEAAAAGGEGWAYYNLADLFFKGDGVCRDRGYACMLYTEAARRGVGKAFNMLGLLHEEGFDTVPADWHCALEYYEAGSSQGDQDAIENLRRLKSELRDRLNANSPL